MKVRCATSIFGKGPSRRYSGSGTQFDLGQGHADELDLSISLNHQSAPR